MINVNTANLRPAEWRATYVLTPDLKLLTQSIADHGWLYPIIARTDGVIIDGFHRWLIAQSDKTIMARDRGQVPVNYIDCDDTTAKMMHIRLNRARGFLVVKQLSRLVQDLRAGSTLEDNALRVLLGMTKDEFDVLVTPSLIKSRKLVEREYSPAWVPVEVPAGQTVTVPPIDIERPPNPDR